MDVISLIAKPEEFPGGPAGVGGYSNPRSLIAADPKAHEYLKEMRREVFDGRDVMTVGEASATTLENAVYFSGRRTWHDEHAVCGCRCYLGIFIRRR